MKFNLIVCCALLFASVLLAAETETLTFVEKIRVDALSRDPKTRAEAAYDLSYVWPYLRESDEGCKVSTSTLIRLLADSDTQVVRAALESTGTLLLQLRTSPSDLKQLVDTPSLMKHLDYLNHNGNSEIRPLAAFQLDHIKKALAGKYAP